MKTNFTKEEIYEAYSHEIIDCLVFHFKVVQSIAEETLVKSGFKKEFLNHMEDYEFCEPFSIAKDLHKTYLLNN